MVSQAFVAADGARGGGAVRDDQGEYDKQRYEAAH
jgi:hypothetical protein